MLSFKTATCLALIAFLVMAVECGSSSGGGGNYNPACHNSFECDLVFSMQYFCVSPMDHVSVINIKLYVDCAAHKTLPKLRFISINGAVIRYFVNINYMNLHNVDYINIEWSLLKWIYCEMYSNVFGAQNMKNNNINIKGKSCFVN